MCYDEYTQDGNYSINLSEDTINSFKKFAKNRHGCDEPFAISSAFNDAIENWLYDQDDTVLFNKEIESIPKNNDIDIKVIEIKKELSQANHFLENGIGKKETLCKIKEILVDQLIELSSNERKRIVDNRF